MLFYEKHRMYKYIILLTIFSTFLTITQIYHDHQANGILTHTKTDLQTKYFDLNNNTGG